MREILFKAKRKDNGEWIEGYYVYCRKRHYILQVLNKAIGFDERDTNGLKLTQTLSVSTQDLPTRMVRRFGRMIFCV